MADPRVGRAISVVKYALYSDPLMDEVQVIRTILKKSLTKEERAILIGVAGGVPIKWYRTFYSTWITEIIKRAAYKLMAAVDIEVEAQNREFDA